MERARAAFHRMDASDQDVNFRTVAAEANVSTAWLYPPGGVACSYHALTQNRDSQRTPFRVSRTGPRAPVQAEYRGDVAVANQNSLREEPRTD